MEEILSIVGGVARFVAILGGALSAVFIGWAGIQWMTASGDPQRMSQARLAIIGAIVGLVIVGVAFMIPGIISEIVIEPAGGMAIEGQKGVDCDGILRQQLVINRAASTGQRMQFVIRQIQSKRGECGVESWNPVVDVDGGSPGVSGSGSSSSVGGMGVPGGLLAINSGDVPRECRQINLVQIIIARIWQMARKESAFLAYRVATPRHCLKSKKPFSTRCRSLYSARSYSRFSRRLLLGGITGFIPRSVAVSMISLVS